MMRAGKLSFFVVIFTVFIFAVKSFLKEGNNKRETVVKNKASIPLLYDDYNDNSGKSWRNNTVEMLSDFNDAYARSDNSIYAASDTMENSTAINMKNKINEIIQKVRILDDNSLAEKQHNLEKKIEDSDIISRLNNKAILGEELSAAKELLDERAIIGFEIASRSLSRIEGNLKEKLIAHENLALDLKARLENYSR